MKKILLRLLVSLVAVILAAGIVCSGVLEQSSDNLNDRVYQQGNLSSGNIILIEINEDALDELGPYNTWTRDYVAEAIEVLNEDEENAPAVIGVDILYIGNTYEDSDNHLVEAASKIDNVVMGSYLNFDSSLETDGDSFTLNKIVSMYEEPFDDLKAVTDVGFVNGISDRDGVVRHGIQRTYSQDGKCLKDSDGNDVRAVSFSEAVYKKYAEAYGLDTEVVMPVNDDNLWYIDYTDVSGGYSNSFSLSDLICGEIPAEYFAGNIVLIGPYAEGLMDSYVAPIDKSELMYGVEIHANMIEAMLDGRTKQEVPMSTQLIVIIIIVMLAAYCCSTGRLIWGLLGCGIPTVIYPIVAYKLYESGWLLNIIYIPLCCVLILISAIVIHYVLAILEKRKVEQTFKRYVAPEVVEEITRRGLSNIKLGGEAVDCAILFVDIRGFTTMSEALEPETVVSILNKYLELTSGSIFKYGGTLDKFIGDATMAIFGAPLPQEDYIYKAVCAAWDMVISARELSAELEKEFGRSVSFGVGVHCGKAVVGNIGTARRMDFTAIGDTVNTSARLEANAPRDTVYISKNVRDALGDRIEAESIGNLPLKGKSEELEVFKVTEVYGI